MPGNEAIMFIDGDIVHVCKLNVVVATDSLAVLHVQIILCQCNIYSYNECMHGIYYTR